MFVLLIMLSGLWPLIPFGQPSYIADSSSYYRGGQAAWERLTELVWSPGTSSVSSATPVKDPVKQTVGVRSLVYSAAAFILSWPGTSMLLLIVSQVAVAALLLWLFLRLTGASSWGYVLGVPTVLGLATSFPVFSTLSTPDFWAGLMILSLLLLGLFSSKLKRIERLFIALSLAFAVASHASHILLAVCSFGVISMVALAQRYWRLAFVSSDNLAAAAGALIVGLGISVVSGLVAFGEASPVPKRYPFALARAIEDGPARWYLEDKCPEAHYTVCELFPDGIPGGVGDFLWAKGGLAQRATPEQMERIRAEEPEILSAAFAAYPWFQIQASSRNVLRQFAEITIPPAVYQGRYMDSDGYLQSAAVRRSSFRWQEMLQGSVVLLSLLLLCGGFARATPPLKVAIVSTAGLIILNNLICAILSAPDLRYQSRLLWLLPVLALLVLGHTPLSGTLRLARREIGERPLAVD